MKIDVTELRMNEVRDIAARLRRLNMHTCFSIMGGRALLVASRVPALQKEGEEIERVAW